MLIIFKVFFKPQPLFCLVRQALDHIIFSVKDREFHCHTAVQAVRCAGDSRVIGTDRHLDLV
jgi:hypothetical protein